MSTHHTEFAGEGAVRQEGPLRITNCKRCGIEIVWATSSKSGKKYPVNVEQGYLDQRYYNKRNAHDCSEADIMRQGDRMAWEIEQAMEQERKGVVCKWADVEIVRGRKFPIGTRGTVRAMMSQPDAYGTIKAKVAIDNAAGETEFIWVDVRNLETLAGPYFNS
jgi:hypothetical protein